MGFRRIGIQITNNLLMVKWISMTNEQILVQMDEVIIELVTESLVSSDHLAPLRS
jgi:hypothetical protein